GAALISDVDKLVVVEPPLPLEEPGIAPEHHSAVRAAVDRGEEEAAVLLALRHALRLEPEGIDALRRRSDWPRLLQRGVAWLRELDEINQLPADVSRYRAIEAPVLLVYGSASQHRRRAAVEALANGMPNTKLIGVEGHGHDVANTAAEDVASPSSRSSRNDRVGLGRGPVLLGWFSVRILAARSLIVSLTFASFRARHGRGRCSRSQRCDASAARGVRLAAFSPPIGLLRVVSLTATATLPHAPLLRPHPRPVLRAHATGARQRPAAFPA